MGVVIFADDSILVINKPAGLRTITDGYDASLPTVITQMSPEWGRLYVVHRLDKDTSGVLLLARTAEAHRNLDRQFAQRQVRKVYHAVCIGIPPWQEIELSSPLLVNGDRRHRTVVNVEKGKPALTRAKVIDTHRTLSLVYASPHTGYTHQIRAHLSTAGYPLLGDTLYAYRRDFTGIRIDASLLPSFQRPALHAFSLSLDHPHGGPVAFEAPYTDDFAELMKVFEHG